MKQLLKGVVGDSELTYEATIVNADSPLDIQLAPEAVLLRVREVYPDSPEQPRCTYDLTVDDRLVYRRDYVGIGFGPVSYFVYLPEWARNKTLTVNVKGKDPRYCLSVPNQWSSTPWLTMNSRKLNDYRLLLRMRLKTGLHSIPQTD